MPQKFSSASVKVPRNPRVGGPAHARSQSVKVPLKRDGGSRNSSSKSFQEKRARSTSLVDSIVGIDVGQLHRRHVVQRSPDSFRRVALYHLMSSFISIASQIAVTTLVLTCPDDIVLFHMDSPNANVASKASIGLIAGVMYLLLGLYGLYLARKLFSFPAEVLKNKLWCFNVLNGLSIVASLLLFAASSFLAKSSQVWYEEKASPPIASAVLGLSLLMTVISCFEICVGAGGVFMR